MKLMLGLLPHRSVGCFMVLRLNEILMFFSAASEQKRVRREVGDVAGAEGYHHKNEGNIVGGYKATLRSKVLPLAF